MLDCVVALICSIDIFHTKYYDMLFNDRNKITDGQCKLESMLTNVQSNQKLVELIQHKNNNILLT